MYWKFELLHNNQVTPIEEPVGWDSISFKLKRDKKLYGLEFEFTEELSFYKTARGYLENVYNTEGIEANVFIRIHEAQNKYTTPKLFYTGKLVLKNRVVDEVIFRCKIEAVGFVREFKNQRRINVKLNPNKEITVKSKTIQLTSEAKPNEALNPYKTGVIKFNELQTPPFEWVSTELPGTQLTTSFDRYEVFYYNNSNEERVVDFDLRLKGKFTLLSGSLTGTPFVIFYVNIDLNSGGETVVEHTPLTYLQNSDGSFDVSLKFTKTLTPNVFINFNYLVTDSLQKGVDREWQVEFSCEESYFRMQALTNFRDTTVKGVKVFDALEQIVNSYGGSVQSDFFEADCNANFLTNGLLLRNAQNSELTVSFETLLNDLQKIFNLGLEIQESQVVIERMPYFFTNELLVKFDHPRDLKNEVAEDFYFSDIKLGYDKWKDSSVGIVNSVDEFNSKRQYRSGFKSVENTLELECKNLITAGYLIESTRRLSAESTATSAFDNDLFLLELNDEGTATAKNEKLDGGVFGVIDYQTVSNVMYSPGRMLRRWAGLVAGIMVKSSNPDLQNLVFASGEGNYQMYSASNRECLVKGEVNESSNVVLQKSDAILVPEYLKFSHPLNFQDFLNIRNNSRRYIEVSGYKGYLVECDFRPAEGLADFILIRKNDAYKP